MISGITDSMEPVTTMEISAEFDPPPPAVCDSQALRPTVIGNYEIACAELCGLGHYKMHGMVHVVSQEDFDKWLAAREAEKQ